MVQPHRRAEHPARRRDDARASPAAARQTATSSAISVSSSDRDARITRSTRPSSGCADGVLGQLLGDVDVDVGEELELAARLGSRARRSRSRACARAGRSAARRARAPRGRRSRRGRRRGTRSRGRRTPACRRASPRGRGSAPPCPRAPRRRGSAARPRSGAGARAGRGRRGPGASRARSRPARRRRAQSVSTSVPPGAGASADATVSAASRRRPRASGAAARRATCPAARAPAARTSTGRRGTCLHPRRRELGVERRDAAARSARLRCAPQLEDRRSRAASDAVPSSAHSDGLEERRARVQAPLARGSGAPPRPRRPSSRAAPHEPQPPVERVALDRVLDRRARAGRGRRPLSRRGRAGGTATPPTAGAPAPPRPRVERRLARRPRATAAWLREISRSSRNGSAWAQIRSQPATSAATPEREPAASAAAPGGLARGRRRAVAGPVRRPSATIATTVTAVSSHIQSIPAATR